MNKDEEKIRKDEENSLLIRRTLVCDILHGTVFIAIIFGALFWTLMIVEAINILPQYGFLLKDNPIHAGGSMFVAIFLILFPLGWYMRRTDRYFHQWKRDIWRKT